jgi:hypothetical protein
MPLVTGKNYEMFLKEMEALKYNIGLWYEQLYTYMKNLFVR